jgi:threonine dehydratase
MVARFMVMATNDPTVTIDTISEAGEGLRGIAMRTPLVPFTTPAGRPLLLKAESLQAIGAFKIRGAYNAIARLRPEEWERGVVAASSGNHAQGVARAARLLGTHATIFMPVDAPAVKQERVRADGAEVVGWDPADPVFIQDAAAAFAAERGLALVHSYDNEAVIAGQGTVGLEIAEDLADLAAVLVPVGGGGLISGIATAVRGLRPGVRIVGVEPALAADAQESLRGGELVQWPRELGRRTIADGTRTNLSRRTFGYISRLVDDIVTVDDDEIAAAVRLIAERSRLVVEPSGALGVAAACFRAEEAGLDGREGAIVAVISGGNVDPERYRAYLEASIPEL